MTILEKLNLTDKTRAAMLTSPETRVCMKMLDALETQISVVEAEQAGETYVKRASRFVTDTETGDVGKTERRP